MAGEEYVSLVLGGGALALSLIIARSNAGRADKKEVLEIAEDIEHRTEARAIHSADRIRELERRLAVLEGRQAERDRGNRGRGAV